MDQYKPYDRLINERRFELASPEVYNKVIPKYYTKVNKGDLPRINGVRVSVEEYMEAHPEYVPDQEFVPEMVYTPEEQNVAISMEPVAAMVDYIDNNIEFSIGKPETNYPEIIDILRGYIELCQYYPGRADIQKYKSKVEVALQVIGEAYEKFKSRLYLRQHGTLATPESEFDRISKTFVQGV